jgi:hypothetical protein
MRVSETVDRDLDAERARGSGTTASAPAQLQQYAVHRRDAHGEVVGGVPMGAQPVVLYSKLQELGVPWIDVGIPNVADPADLEFVRVDLVPSIAKLRVVPRKEVPSSFSRRGSWGLFRS